MHVKLFNVYGETAGSEVERVYPNLVWFNDKIIGIPYENRRDSYRDLIETVKNIEIKQLMITAETFLNIITSSVAERFSFLEMEFVESVPKENQEIVSYYRKKLAEEKNMIKRKLLIQNFFSELDWIIREESIDIKKIRIGVETDGIINEGTTLFNNGILIVENDAASPSLLNILKEVE